MNRTAARRPGARAARHRGVIGAAVALCVLAPVTAGATNWQTFQADYLTVREIDADSVRVVDDLVHYRYRTRLANGTANGSFDAPIDAVVDCEGRRHGDVTRTGHLELRPVFEKTVSALKLDTACRLAGRAHVVHTGGEVDTVRDWVAYDDHAAIDRNSVDAHDGLVFFDYRARGQYSREASAAVVDCAHRQRSEHVGRNYNLQPLFEGGTQALQAEMACRLAQQPMPPAPKPAPVDFAAHLDPGDVGSDDVMYAVDRNSLSTRDGLVHFLYVTPWLTDGSRALEPQPVAAVVDCAGRRRSDVVDDRFDLQPAVPGTRGAAQVERVCAMAAAPAP